MNENANWALADHFAKLSFLSLLPFGNTIRQPQFKYPRLTYAGSIELVDFKQFDCFRVSQVSIRRFQIGARRYVCLFLAAGKTVVKN